MRDFDGKSVFGLIWHHGRAGARTRAAEFARLHGRAGWGVSPPLERNKTRGNARLAITRAAEVPRKAVGGPRGARWKCRPRQCQRSGAGTSYKKNYPPNEGTQTPADCALTAPPVRRTNWRPSLPRLRRIGRACRHSALVAWAVTGQRRTQSTADKKTETAVR